MRRDIVIVGPGRMGVGIATAVLMAGQGHRITLLDTKPREPGSEDAALKKAHAEVGENLELLRRLGAIERPGQDLLQNLRCTREWDETAAGSSLVFEALPETFEAKEPFYADLGTRLGPGAVVASATSTFDVGFFATRYAHPGQVLTAHWLNPAFLIPLVEIARTEQTDPTAVQTVKGFLGDIGKVPVTLRSSPGFVVPRIQAAAMNEAVRIIEEGVATAEEIDTAIKAGFGFRLAVLGLVEFIDLGGVDILAHAGKYLHATLGQNHFQPPKLVSEKMARGEVGPRAGKGFYNYTGTDTRALFESRYKGFLELLELYQRSKALRFQGGTSA